MTSQAGVLFIAVTYRSNALAARFVEGLSPMLTSGTIRVVLIDNSADEQRRGELAAMLRPIPAVTCLEPPENLGYFHGALHGLKHHLKGSPLPDWIVVSNVDLSFEPGRLVEMLESVRDERVGVVAPRIVLERKDIDLNPLFRARPSGKRMRFLNWMFASYGRYVVYSLLSALRGEVAGRLRQRPARPARTEAIYAPHGAMFCFHKRYFERGGSLAKAAFLYGEEIVVAEECRRLALDVLYVPSVTVRHRSGSRMSLIKSRKMHDYERLSIRAIVHDYF